MRKGLVPLMPSILHCNSSQLVILLCFALCECEEEGLLCPPDHFVKY